MVSLAYPVPSPEPPKTAVAQQNRKIIQCGTCGLVLYGKCAGEKLLKIPSAEIAQCFACYTRICRTLREQAPDAVFEPYRAANRHVRPLIPLPSAMFYGDPGILTPGVLRVYGEIFQRGADHAWVAASLVELAAALGYSRYHVHSALQRLCPHYIEMRRESERSVPAFRIVRPL